MNRGYIRELAIQNREAVYECLPIDALAALLKDRYGVEVPVTDGSGNRKNYKRKLIDCILACEFGAEEQQR